MSLGEHPYVIDRADSTDYEPMIIDGVQVGEAHWLRTDGSHGNPHEVAYGAPTRPQGTSMSSRGTSRSRSSQVRWRSSSSPRASAWN